MKNTPINRKTVSNAISSSGITDLGYASIREIVKLVNILISETGVEFIRMEMGVPGLPSAEVGVKAEIDALEKGWLQSILILKDCRSSRPRLPRFVKLFLDIDVSPECCVPTGGCNDGRDGKLHGCQQE